MKLLAKKVLRYFVVPVLRGQQVFKLFSDISV